jgi:hypothetical protein
VSTPYRLSWLLEPENPSSRYLALTKLLGRVPEDPDVLEAKAAIPGWGPARDILEAQWPGGYWMRPGVGYSPKHKATVWQVVFLAALGTPLTQALADACAYVLKHSLLPDGCFSAHRTRKGAVACLNGNLLRAMLRVGYQDVRLSKAQDAMAQAILRDEFRCRFNARSPRPALMREGMPCAWGAIKTLGAFAETPASERTTAVQEAIRIGTRLLLSGDLARGDYPTATKPSPLWLRFGFPLGYTSDLLEALEVLGQLQVEPNDLLRTALGIVREKQDEDGCWSLDHTPDNMWTSFGTLGRPSKWVTLRALHVLRLWEEPADLS